MSVRPLDNILDPLAQTFYVNSISGIYLTKVGIFFQNKPDTGGLPITLQIRPAFSTNNVSTTGAGVPSSDNYLDGSNVTLNPSQVKVSASGTDDFSLAASDGQSVETIFQFDAPIFLSGNKYYAIILKTQAPVGEYKVWTGVLGEFPIGSQTERISKQLNAGVLFRSSMGSSVFSPDQNVDLCFKLYRASFPVGTKKAILKNKKISNRNLKLFENPINTYDYPVLRFDSGSPYLNIISPANGTQDSDIFVISKGVNGPDSASSIAGVTWADIYGSRSVIRRDNLGIKVLMGATATNSVTTTVDSGVSVSNMIEYESLKSLVDIITPSNTDYVMSATLTTAKSLASGGSQKETAYQAVSGIRIPNRKRIYFNKPFLISNPYNEGTGSRPDQSVNLYVALTTKDSNVAPVIDLQRASLNVVHNMVDYADSTGVYGTNLPIGNDSSIDETQPNIINGSARWISRPATVSQSARGLKVQLDAYRPVDTDFDLYYRVLSQGEDISIRNKNWVKANKNEPASNYNTLRRIRRSEITVQNFEFLIGGNYLGRSFDDYNVTFDPFDTYQIKIVMKSKSSAVVPVIKNLRIIALIDEYGD